MSVATLVFAVAGSLAADHRAIGSPRRSSLSFSQIVSIFGVVFALGIGLWALKTYSDYRAAVRAAETERYLNAFESGQVGDAWARLRQAWNAERSRQDALLEHFSSSSGDGRPALSDYHSFVLETIDAHELRDEVSTVLIYFRGLAFCIRTGGCDGTAVARRVGDLAWRFRNQHYYYLVEAFPDLPFDVDFQTIAPRRDDQPDLFGP